MPTASEWSDATAVAGALLGVSGAAHLTAPAVADFVGKVVERATALTATAPSLTSAVEAAYQHMSLPSGQRLDTARRSAELVQQLRHLSGVELVRRIGSADLGGATPAAAGTSLASAEKVSAALNGFEWSRLAPLFEAISSEADSDGRAAAVVQSLSAALQQDELVTPVAKALKEADDGIFALAGLPGPTTH